MLDNTEAWCSSVLTKSVYGKIHDDYVLDHVMSGVKCSANLGPTGADRVGVLLQSGAGRALRPIRSLTTSHNRREE